MLQKISYFNLIFTIAYALIYFRDNTLNFTMGVLMIVLFNWLALRSNQNENYKWSILHYVSALWCIYYVGYLVYGTVNILSSAIQYQFASNDTITFIILSFVLSIVVLLQLLIYFLSNLKAAHHSRF